MEKSVSYSAVVLGPKSAQMLKSKFFADIPEGWEWVGHHMTICLGAIEDQGIRAMIGKEVVLCVDAVGKNDNALAVRVSGFYSKSDHPHITLAVNRNAGGKPKHSKDIEDWRTIAADIRLHGTITEIYN